MSNRVMAVLLAIVLTVLTVVAVVGHHDPLEGPVIFGLSETHGVHVGDLLVVAAWAVGVACCWRLWRRGVN